LSDPISVSEGDPSEIALITSDDTDGDLEGMVPRLQRNARNHGFEVCEVREFSCPDPDDYVLLFVGPIPTLTCAS
jgi:hypothetical protein